MTGYGKAQFEDDQIFVRVEIKSVNSKQFDLKLKLPIEFTYKEAWLRSELQKMLYRGKIDCYVTLERQDIVPYQINENAAKQYFETLKKLAKEFGYKTKQFDALQIIMRLPDVLRPRLAEEDEPTWQKIYNVILQAVEQLKEFRKQEGQAMEKDLRQKVQNIQEALNKVPQYEQQRIENVKQRLLNALQNLQVEYDKERFEQELLYYLDKYDINEEKVRLQNHIKYFLETLEGADGQPVGKTLSFIAQEMGREINTLGAKAYDFNIQQLVVVMKDNLEKIKEQLANVL
jgi:uncharacterized protein (TIGR00255 family)